MSVEKVDISHLLRGRGTTEYIRVDLIEMAPPHWGRKINPAHVKRIGLGFDPDKFGVPAVWRLHKGTNKERVIAVDCQHRVRAIVDVLGYGDQLIECTVFDNLIDQEAAEISGGLQARRNLAPYDQYRTDLASEFPRNVNVQKAVDNAGLRITQGNAKVGEIRAVAGLLAVYDRLGYEGLFRVLIISNTAWVRESAAISSPSLKMVGSMLAAHPEIEDERLIKVLERQPSAAWTASLGNGTMKRNIGHLCQEIADSYNKRLAAKNKLELFAPGNYTQAFKRRVLEMDPPLVIQGRTIIGPQTGAIRAGRREPKVPVPKRTKKT